MQSPSSTQPGARPLIVQKYGGMSLSTPDQIRAAARRVAKLRARGINIIAVVSAMGAATDGLIQLAYSVSSKPNRRELDMLLSTGERVSMALFSMALSEALAELAPDAKAISFTGSQAGVLTDETHSNARIIDIKSIRVQEELTRGNVVILAGFQGVSPKTKEITTLGRGGTDVTAVAMAAAFKATRCEILKEVPGVFSADPKLVADARPLTTLTHEQLLDMTFWGAKVLHYRSVELALTHGVPIAVGLAHALSETALTSFTHITPNEDSQMKPLEPSFENPKVLAVTAHADVRSLSIQAASIAQGLALMHETLNRQTLPPPQVLNIDYVGSALHLLVTAPTESLEAQIAALIKKPAVKIETKTFSTVRVTCQGTYTTEFIAELLARLETQGIRPEKVLPGALGVTFVVNENQRRESVTTLHSYSA